MNLQSECDHHITFAKKKRKLRSHWLEYLIDLPIINLYTPSIVKDVSTCYRNFRLIVLIAKKPNPCIHVHRSTYNKRHWRATFISIAINFSLAVITMLTDYHECHTITNYLQLFPQIATSGRNWSGKNSGQFPAIGQDVLVKRYSAKWSDVKCLLHIANGFIQVSRRPLESYRQGVMCTDQEVHKHIFWSIFHIKGG